MFTVIIYLPTQEIYPHRWRNNHIKMQAEYAKKKNFKQVSPNLCTSLPHCLNIYKLFSKWQRHPVLKKYYR